MMAAIAALMLTGCSMTPVPTYQARPSRVVLSADLTTPREGAAHIIVKQDDGQLCPSRIYVGGVPAFELRSAERGDLYVKPGTVLLGINGANWACKEDTITELETTVAAGETKVFRVGPYLVLQPTSL